MDFGDSGKSKTFSNFLLRQRLRKHAANKSRQATATADATAATGADPVDLSATLPPGAATGPPSTPWLVVCDVVVVPVLVTVAGLPEVDRSRAPAPPPQPLIVKCIAFEVQRCEEARALDALQSETSTCLVASRASAHHTSRRRQAAAGPSATAAVPLLVAELAATSVPQGTAQRPQGPAKRLTRRRRTVGV